MLSALLSGGLLIILVLQFKYYKTSKSRSKFTNGGLQGSGSSSESEIESGEDKCIPMDYLPVPGVPVFTITQRFLSSGYKFSALYNYMSTLQPVVSLPNFTGRRLIIINDFNLCKEAFFNPKFNGKVSTPSWLAHSHGKYGKRQLKQFGFGTKSMEPLIQVEINAFLDILEKSRGQLMSLNKLLYAPILNPLWWILTGERFANEDDRGYQLVMKTFHAINRCLKIPFIIVVYLTSLSLSTIDCISNCLPMFVPKEASRLLKLHELRSYFKELIEDKRKSLHPTDTPRDFLEAHLLETMNCTNPDSGFFQQNGLKNLLGIMADFFIAGGDTTANELTWALLHLIRNPEIQQEIQSEIDSVVGQDRLPQLQDRLHCPRTEAFLEEVLRVNPVALSSLPHETLQDVPLGPYLIPKGSTVFANIYGINYDPKIWGDPQNFRPSRFLTSSDSDSEGSPPTFIRHEGMSSFSIGRRRCLGEQLARDNMFLFLSSICQRFTLEMENPVKPPPVLEQANSAIHAPAKYSLYVRDRLGKNLN